VIKKSITQTISQITMRSVIGNKEPFIAASIIPFAINAWEVNWTLMLR
jgi:hypothetical protein